MSKIFEDECLEDLQINDLYIIQKKSGFRFGTDAICLSDFVVKRKYNRILDLCTGSGIIPILLYAKTDAKKIMGLEIQKNIADMAKRSVEYNCIGDCVSITEGDLKECDKYFTKHSFDAVTCNPPYMKSGANVQNMLDTKTISRHEVMCTLEDVIKAASDMLRYHGTFYMVHRPSRLTDIISFMRKYNIEPKRLQFIYSDIEKKPSLILIEGSYYGGCELTVLPPKLI